MMMMMVMDSTRVMNSLVWFDCDTPREDSWRGGEGRRLINPSYPHSARRFELRLKQLRKVLLVCPPAALYRTYRGDGGGVFFWDVFFVFFCFDRSENG